jgi:hypothetical protein
VRHARTSTPRARSSRTLSCSERAAVRDPGH